MEKDQFIDVDKKSWWLLEIEIDPSLDQKRKTLGECWEWTDLQWFTERLKMEEVYQFLELHKSELLRELDEANDLYRRDQWLDNVIQAKRPPKKQAAPQEAAQPAGNAAEVSAKPAAAVPPAAPVKKPSAFGRARTTEEASAEPTAGTPAASGAPAGAAQPAEPKKPSPFGRKAAAPAASSPAGGAAEGGAPPPPVSEQIQSVMTNLSPDELSSIAGDLGLTAEEVEAMVQDPDFASMVAEEQAQLERS